MAAPLIEYDENPNDLPLLGYDMGWTNGTHQNMEEDGKEINVWIGREEQKEWV
jgi:hypothetical protein